MSCQGITKKNLPCGNRPKGSNRYCYLHVNQEGAAKPQPVKVPEPLVNPFKVPINLSQDPFKIPINLSEDPFKESEPVKPLFKPRVCLLKMGKEPIDINSTCIFGAELRRKFNPQIDCEIMDLNYIKYIIGPYEMYHYKMLNKDLIFFGELHGYMTNKLRVPIDNDRSVIISSFIKSLKEQLPKHKIDLYLEVSSDYNQDINKKDIKCSYTGVGSIYSQFKEFFDESKNRKLLETGLGDDYRFRAHWVDVRYLNLFKDQKDSYLLNYFKIITIGHKFNQYTFDLFYEVCFLLGYYPIMKKQLSKLDPILATVLKIDYIAKLFELYQAGNTMDTLRPIVLFMDLYTMARQLRPTWNKPGVKARHNNNPNLIITYVGGFHCENYASLMDLLKTLSDKAIKKNRYIDPIKDSVVKLYDTIPNMLNQKDNPKEPLDLKDVSLDQIISSIIISSNGSISSQEVRSNIKSKYLELESKYGNVFSVDDEKEYLRILMIKMMDFYASDIEYLKKMQSYGPPLVFKI